MAVEETNDNVACTRGLQAWEARRRAWTEPNQQYLDKQKNAATVAGKCNVAFEQEVHQKAIYKQLVHQHRILKTPISLKYIIPILVTGWQEDGVWPKGEVVQEKSD
ncbi:uncharacterized protein ATC70_010819 [Mucor velutinosus]|uniref:Gag1-like clamp domain-containing protein n=1 Tax=Mucor velutinosus TaxID=708070 RepID=A0AAN7DJ42_9FUNG|nr:hypothetical protein ATC70_010819 [Mucor velutinosus]